MDLPLIPRVAVGPRHGKEVTVWVIPQQGKSPGQVEAELQTAGVNPPAGTAGTVGANAYTIELPADTSAESILDFAQRASLALGVQPGQGWQWISRGRDQLPQ